MVTQVNASLKELQTSFKKPNYSRNTSALDTKFPTIEFHRDRTSSIRKSLNDFDTRNFLNKTKIDKPAVIEMVNSGIKKTSNLFSPEHGIKGYSHPNPMLIDANYKSRIHKFTKEKREIA